MYDYHTHSNISDDGNAPMEAMAEAGAAAGLREIAITDHYDPDYPDPDWSSDLDFPHYHKELERTAERFASRIRVVKGIEIGLQHGSTLEKCRSAAAAYPYDFIIGSFHCAEGFELSHGGFFDDRTVDEATEAFYSYVYDTLLQTDAYDVLGHINVVDRYGSHLPTPSCGADQVDAILRHLIEKGKGIEINTSSFRYGMGNHTTPTDRILRRYRELGGEIITVGSDAHAPRHVGHGLQWGYDTLRGLGYRYVTCFSRRSPRFVAIP